MIPGHFGTSLARVHLIKRFQRAHAEAQGANLQVSLEDTSVVVMLQLFIGEIDAQLLEVVLLKILKSKNIKKPAGLGAAV